jgi:Domain of unknown function (DUF1840)
VGYEDKLGVIAIVEKRMIYEFKCRATGSIIMTQTVAERLLEIIDVHAGTKGIITVSKMPASIEALERAIALEKEQAKAQAAPPQTDIGEGHRDSSQTVSLAQRAFPMIEMMRAALAAQKDITWGV